MPEQNWQDLCLQNDACALSGAAAFFAGIPDAMMVANAPIWCYFYALRYLEPTSQELGKRFFCSQPDNSAVVYGSEECLLQTLETVKQSGQPGILLIENSCALGLIGDDIAAIAAKADLKCPVICLDSGGLTGGFQAGYRAAAKAYFSKVRLDERRQIRPRSVNLLGLGTGYYNSRNDVLELKRLLQLAGFEVIATPGAGSNTARIAELTAAELNIVVHQELGQETAEFLKREYGMPYCCALPPYGIEGSSAWLKMIESACCGQAQQNYRLWQREADEARRFIAEATLDLQRSWGEPWFDNILLAAPPSVALGLGQALRCEWLDTGKMTALLHGARLNLQTPQCFDLVLDEDAQSLSLQEEFKLLGGGLLLGSANEQGVLERLKVSDVQKINISLPVHDEVILNGLPFMGLRGALNLCEKVWGKHISSCRRIKMS